MLNTVKIKCPAKINLTLEVVNRREDGFHNIKSIMQMISLYDYLTITVTKLEENEINLSGTSEEIPYDDKNLVYKAAKLFLQKAGLKNIKIDIFIEKNIPISAGLAGGSTDAAGTIFGLNKLFSNMFTEKTLHEMCSTLGSDLNVCLSGGCNLATSRGEVIKPLPTLDYNLTLIKPKNLGISAKEAYTKYAAKKNKPKYNRTENMMMAILSGSSVVPYLYNDLEYAVFDDYIELQKIKKSYPDSIMSGSGSTYFVLNDINKSLLDESYEVYENLKFISFGVEVFV